MDSLAFRVASQFLAEMAQTAVIREEHGEFCVRSPHNKDWNGGCFKSKGEAEDRLRQVEYFKRQASELREVWLVRDWNNRIEYVADMVSPVSIEELPKYVIGTGLALWRKENTKVFTDKESAMEDFERRMKPVDEMHLKNGLYRHMHGDGRIIYVSVPDRS
jgi:hypothetical protein